MVHDRTIKNFIQTHPTRPRYERHRTSTRQASARDRTRHIYGTGRSRRQQLASADHEASFVVSANLSTPAASSSVDGILDE